MKLKNKLKKFIYLQIMVPLIDAFFPVFSSKTAFLVATLIVCLYFTFSSPFIIALAINSFLLIAYAIISKYIKFEDANKHG